VLFGDYSLHVEDSGTQLGKELKTLHLVPGKEPKISERVLVKLYKEPPQELLLELNPLLKPQEMSLVELGKEPKILERVLDKPLKELPQELPQVLNPLLQQLVILPVELGKEPKLLELMLLTVEELSEKQSDKL
jgi:hypothetical protein